MNTPTVTLRTETGVAPSVSASITVPGALASVGTHAPRGVEQVSVPMSIISGS